MCQSLQIRFRPMQSMPLFVQDSPRSSCGQAFLSKTSISSSTSSRSTCRSSSSDWPTGSPPVDNAAEGDPCGSRGCSGDGREVRGGDWVMFRKPRERSIPVSGFEQFVVEAIVGAIQGVSILGIMAVVMGFGLSALMNRVATDLTVTPVEHDKYKEASERIR